MRNNAGISILFAACAAVAKKQASPIEHVITLVMENRPFDHFFGFSQEEIGDLNGLTGDEFNYVDGESGDKTYVAKGSAQYVCANGPSQAFDATCTDWFGKEKGGFACATAAGAPAQDESGFVYANGHDEVMWQFSADQVPIKTQLAQEFALMDAYYSSFAGPSTPNHLFIQTATAAGCTSTGATYHCDGSSFPQRTVYENLADAGLTWQYYYNDSAWNTFLDYFNKPAGAAGVVTYDEFYARAASGTLPNFAFILPRQGTNFTTGEGSNDDHPCHDVALGEKLLKQTYEALRAGPGWNKTLLVVTYDDFGGFYDHAPLVTEGVPAPDDEPSCPSTTDYTMLGPRVPTLLISPWVKRNRVVHAPDGALGTPARPTASSQYAEPPPLRLGCILRI